MGVSIAASWTTTLFRQTVYRKRHFEQVERQGVFFVAGAPAKDYYLPDINTYLFNRHQRFALAQAIEISSGNVPARDNVLLMIDRHKDYAPAGSRPLISINTCLGSLVAKVARWIRRNVLDEVNFTAPFLDSGNITKQINWAPAEYMPRGERAGQLKPDLIETYTFDEAKNAVLAQHYYGKLVVTIDMDFFYLPVFHQKSWAFSQIIERIDTTVKLLAELKAVGVRIAYFSIATTNFNLNGGASGTKELAIEESTRYLLEEIAVKLA